MLNTSFYTLSRTSHLELYFNLSDYEIYPASLKILMSSNYKEHEIKIPKNLNN